MEPSDHKVKSPSRQIDSSESVDKLKTKYNTVDIDFRIIDNLDSPIKSDNVTPTPFEDISSSTDIGLSAEETSTSMTVPSRNDDISNHFSTESGSHSANSENKSDVSQIDKNSAGDGSINSTESKDEPQIKMDPKVEAILTSISKFTDENNCSKFESANCKMEENYVPSPNLTALTKTLEKLKEENEAILNKKTKPLINISSSIKAELADVRKDTAVDYKQTLNKSLDYLCTEVANLSSAVPQAEVNHLDENARSMKRIRSIEHKVVDAAALGKNLGVKIADLGNACWTVSFISIFH